jgi:ribosome-binding factor A
MAQEYSRIQRIGDQLKREISLLIQQQMRDPRVGMVNINAVEVSRDLAHAKVFVTLVGERTIDQRTSAMRALNKAGGFMRSQIASDTHMRTTPRFSFVYDASVQRGADLSALIDKAVAADSLGASVSTKASMDSEQIDE